VRIICIRAPAQLFKCTHNHTHPTPHLPRQPGVSLLRVLVGATRHVTEVVAYKLRDIGQGIGCQTVLVLLSLVVLHVCYRRKWGPTRSMYAAVTPPCSTPVASVATAVAVVVGRVLVGTVGTAPMLSSLPSLSPLSLSLQLLPPQRLVLKNGMVFVNFIYCQPLLL
jgi:hypothetical protein